MASFRLNTPILFGLICFVCSCKNDQKPVTQTKIEFKKEGELSLFKSNSDSLIIKLDIEIADNDYEIQTGLMHRQTMAKNRGMLFIFPDMAQRSFYMKNTYIPLDLIYLDDKNTIVSFQENAKPLDESSLPSTYPAQYVLEVNAGMFKEWGLNVGYTMEFSKQ